MVNLCRPAHLLAAVGMAPQSHIFIVMHFNAAAVAASVLSHYHLQPLNASSRSAGTSGTLRPDGCRDPEPAAEVASRGRLVLAVGAVCPVCGLQTDETQTRRPLSNHQRSPTSDAFTVTLSGLNSELC